MTLGIVILEAAVFLTSEREMNFLSPLEAEI